MCQDKEAKELAARGKQARRVSARTQVAAHCCIGMQCHSHCNNAIVLCLALSKQICCGTALTRESSLTNIKKLMLQHDLSA